MKKSILILVGVIILALFLSISYLIFFKQIKQKSGVGFENKKITLMGSSSNLVSAPDVFVADNSTTTGSHLADSGHVIQQTINTEGIEEGLLCYSALGGTATSSLYIRQMGSHDGSNFGYVGSTTLDLLTTTTLTTLTKNYSFVPGLSTTTLKCNDINVKGYDFTRLMIKADNVAADPNDGIQAWIYFVAKDDINR